MRIEKYSNDRLRARKARILKTARQIIGAKGVDGLTMRELAEKSDVALATLYNIFGSKDVLVGYAVNDFLEGILDLSVQKAPKKASLEKLLLVLDLIARDVKKSSAYIHVVVALYFKIERDKGVHNMLYNIGHSKFAELLESMRDEANYYDWVSLDLLADEFTEQVLWRILQWGRKAIPDSLLADSMKYSVLQILVGATRGAMTDQINAHLKTTTSKLARLHPRTGR